MYKRILVATILLTTAVLLGCSDSGDSPTGGGGGGTGPSLSVSDFKVLEGQTVVFTVSIDATSSQDVIFDYATSDGDATGTSDYAVTNGKDTIPAGTLSTAVSVATINNAAVEFAESFGLTISAAVNGQIGDATGTATIYDDDGVRFSTDVNPLIQTWCAASGCHGTSSGGFTLSRNNADANYNSIVNGSADHGALLTKRNADASNLYRKLLDPPPFGDRMPRNGPYLSPADIQLIGDWIDQDAQDN
ncbi:MAG: hypothetical protein OEV49_08650 [candidate division Zixibacteria bacterium]|nr:hypothetical protein [candidate division Zixibacteria bacterium]MDH3936863.1 hypothetical protein [candidate division Zixibacteria bacterium]MDH4033704.1 hypothetical protein [candidate division Zixibacteria bacterium]